MVHAHSIMINSGILIFFYCSYL